MTIRSVVFTYWQTRLFINDPTGFNFIFCPNIIYFCSVKLDFSISYKESASKSLQSTEISLYLAFTNELNVAQKEKNIDEWLIENQVFATVAI
jgi:hypothetical protein